MFDKILNSALVILSIIIWYFYIRGVYFEEYDYNGFYMILGALIYFVTLLPLCVIGISKRAVFKTKVISYLAFLILACPFVVLPVLLYINSILHTP